MSDATSKTKAKAASFTPEPEAKAEMPRFEMPKFEMPKMEVPAAFREFAEKSVNQAKDNWERMKAVTEEATDLLEDSYSSTTRGATEYGLKMIETARANTNAAFDYATQLIAVKSLSEAIELSTSHARRQFDALNAQSKELGALAQKVCADAAEPIKQGVALAFKRVA